MGFIGVQPATVPLTANVITDGIISTAKIADDAITSAKLPQGSVIQVVQTTKTDTFSSNETTNFIDLTGMTVSITPTSTTNKIFIMYSLNTGIVGGGYGFLIKLLRGSTEIARGDQDGSNRVRVTTVAQSASSSYPIFLQAMNFLDSPATTSATTYKLQGRGWNSGAGNFYINRSEADGDTLSYGRPISTITAMEIVHDS